MHCEFMVRSVTQLVSFFGLGLKSKRVNCHVMVREVTQLVSLCLVYGAIHWGQPSRQVVNGKGPIVVGSSESSS